MQQVDITVSIVSYNSQKVLDGCLQSVIRAAEGLDAEIIMVDNCSSDSSADFVKSSFPGVSVIVNPENFGFGRAHNQAFRISRGRYFLILNPDTVIEPDALHTMVEFMAAHEYAGATGCKIYWDDEKNFMFPDLRIHGLRSAVMHFTSYALLFPDSLLSKWYWKSAHRVWTANRPLEVEGITGGLMMVRREAFASAGLFDETFFLFFEEHDLLKRIKKKGWKIYYLPDAAIQHYFEESFRNSTIDIDTVYMQSAKYYYSKHYRKAGLWLLKACIFLNPYLESWFNRPDDCETISSSRSSEFFIKWQPVRNEVKYLIEVSYSPHFVDRAGTYIKGTTFTLSTSVLDRLPDRKGFLRILPVYSDGSVGKVIKVIQITE